MFLMSMSKLMRMHGHRPGPHEHEARHQSYAQRCERPGTFLTFQTGHIPDRFCFFPFWKRFLFLLLFLL